MKKLIQHSFFIIRYRYFRNFTGLLRGIWFQIWGMKLGKNTMLPKIYITWPHQVSIGKNCHLEHHIYFKYDGIWNPDTSIRVADRVFIGGNCEFNIRQYIDIGNDSLIASGCKFIDHDHGIFLGKLMRIQEGIEKGITIENNVWLGCNVIVLKGVQIGSGAVVAAGSVVTKSILPNEIWAGVPARKIGERKIE